VQEALQYAPDPELAAMVTPAAQTVVQGEEVALQFSPLLLLPEKPEDWSWLLDFGLTAEFFQTATTHPISSPPDILDLLPPPITLTTADTTSPSPAAPSSSSHPPRPIRAQLSYKIQELLRTAERDPALIGGDPAEHQAVLQEAVQTLKRCMAMAAH
jgi:hypothetical protein